jgi:hypothetical protein
MSDEPDPAAIGRLIAHRDAIAAQLHERAEHDDQLRRGRALGEVLVGPPDVPVTHFLDVGTIDPDGMTIERDVEHPFARGGYLPGPQTYRYDRARDGDLLPFARIAAITAAGNVRALIGQLLDENAQQRRLDQAAAVWARRDRIRSRRRRAGRGRK